MKDNTFRNILWWGVSFVLIFTPLARGAVKTWSIALVELAIFSLIFVWRWREAGEKELTLPAGYAKTPVFLFACLAILSFIFSAYKHDGFFELLRLFAYLGFYWLLISNFDELIFRKLLILGLAIGAGLSLYGILQYAGLLDHSWWSPGNFPAATYVNHNHFSGYLELTIPLGFGFLFSRQSRIFKAAVILALVIMAIAFIISQSRGAWISLGTALLALAAFFVKRNTLKSTSLVILLLTAAVVFSVVLLKDDLVYRRVATIRDAALDRRNLEPSLGTRVLIWQGALAMIRENPFTGAGIGNFDSAFYRYRPEGLNARAVYAHNEYLHVAAEMGVLAGVLLLIILGKAVRTGFKRNNSGQVIGAAAGVLSLALHALTDFNFHITANVLLLIVLIAYIYSRAKRRKICEISED